LAILEVKVAEGCAIKVAQGYSSLNKVEILPNHYPPAAAGGPPKKARRPLPIRVHLVSSLFKLNA